MFRERLELIFIKSIAAYWTTNGMNELAGVGDLTTITRRINGGLNGLEGRLKFYDIAKNALGAGDKPGDFIAEASN
jgi:predicted chitinase